ncbi:HesA/MoeB/ThiF family protein [Candidatus Thorarchaeota archaeon]|nr:MAG: HesA/MoeB/ThiF family protein [Candidatus Thorarchaeota archaeon]
MVKMKLSDIQRERYSRLLALRNIREEDMESIMKTTVAVIGAGGLGSPALRLLAAIGFGKIRIIDRDIVELSNIQRQTIYNAGDIGQPKAEAAAINLALQNPDVEIEPYSVSLHEENALDLLEGIDIIIDGLDSFETRRIVNRTSLKLGIPYIFAGAVEYFANLSTFLPGKTACFNCIMGDAVDNPQTTCANIGVSPTLLSIAASIEVNEALFIATGRTPLLANRLMTIDSDSLSFEMFEISQSNTCQICSNQEVKIEEERDRLSVTMLCSMNFNVSPPKLENLNLERTARLLSESYSVTQTSKSIVIILKSGQKVTLMSSGSAIIEGVNTPEEAKRLYQQIKDLID